MTTRSTQAVAALVAMSRRHSGSALLVWLLLTTLALIYTSLHLRVDADTRELMSPELPWRQDAMALAQAFPERARQLIVVIDGPAGEIARARDALLQSLTGAPGIDTVFAPAGDPWLQRHGLLFLSPEQLQQTIRQLEQAQPFLGRLSQQPSIAALAELLQQAQAHRSQFGGPSLSAVQLQLAAAVSAQDSDPVLDWTTLLTPSAPTRELVLVVPRSGLSPANAVAAVTAGLDTARRAAPTARLRLTGPAAMQVEEMREIAAGVVETAWCSLLGVSLLIAFALRSWRLTAACLLTMLVGLALTTGFATLAVGRLNLISASFAALYIGLAIAYALHFCMRAIELRAQGHGHDAAMQQTANATGTALLLSALTTAAAFYAFIPTRYAAVAELGLIAGSGLLIGFLLTVSLLPALIERYGVVALERAALRMPQARASTPTGVAALKPSRRTIQVLAVLLASGSAWLLPQLRFDHNPLHLNPQNSESFQTLRELMNSSDTPLTASVLAADGRAAEQLSRQLQALPEVHHSVSAASLIPTEQALKLELIADLQLALGGGFAVPNVDQFAADPDRDLAALQRLAAALIHTQDGDPGTRQLADALNEWLQQPSATTPEALQALSHRLLAGLPALLTQINAALEAGPATLDDLPDALRSQWISDDGYWRVEAVPAENLDDDEALQRYADAVISVAPHASDAPIEFAAAARSVIEAFTIAFALALAVILLCLRALLGSFGDSLRALAPVLLGSLLLCAICVLFDLPLNMANLIALPLLLGTNVDAAIHLVLRARTNAAQELTATSTGRAVVYMVLAELAGFASLMLSPHQGIASLGLMFTLGLLLTLGCILWLLPALLASPDADPAPC